MPLNDTLPSSGAGCRPRHWRRAFLATFLLIPAGPALAQPAGPCPPPRKLAAGACVVACPAGYEDRGRDCVYRSLSR
jgi:hypothetical protein